jgi:hypothetical protein
LIIGALKKLQEETARTSMALDVVLKHIKIELTKRIDLGIVKIKTLQE